VRYKILRSELVKSLIARALTDFRGSLKARTFVLVHGGWCGAWAWRDVLSGLRKLGHHASAPTLTGLGERQRCGVATADLATHIEDVVSHIWMEDLSDVTLVEWSWRRDDRDIGPSP